MAKKIQIFETFTPSDEVEGVSSLIASLVKRRKSADDFLVITEDLDSLRNLFRLSFSRYSLAVFFDPDEKLVLTPLVKLILKFLFLREGERRLDLALKQLTNSNYLRVETPEALWDILTQIPPRAKALSLATQIAFVIDKLKVRECLESCPAYAPRDYWCLEQFFSVLAEVTEKFSQQIINLREFLEALKKALSLTNFLSPAPQPAVLVTDPRGGLLNRKQKNLFILGLKDDEKNRDFLTDILEYKVNLYIFYSRLTNLGQPLPRPNLVAQILERFSSLEVKRQEIGFKPSRRLSAKKIKLEEAILDDLKERFASAKYCWAVTSLEQFCRCPYAFYLKNVVSLPPEREVEWGMAALEKGGVIHRILFDLYSYLVKEGLQFSKINRDKIQAISQRIIEKNLEDFYRKIYRDTRMSFELEKGRLRLSLQRFIDQEIDDLDQDEFEPKFFELAFGIKKTGEVDVASLEETLTLKAPGGPIHLKGKIDRLDMGAKDKIFRLDDYKTGSQIPQQKEMLAGESLQLPLYLLAAKKIFFPACQKGEGAFYLIEKRARKHKIGFLSEEEFIEFEKKITVKVNEVIKRIIKADFFSPPPHCPHYCEFKDVCLLKQED